MGGVEVREGDVEVRVVDGVEATTMGMTGATAVMVVDTVVGMMTTMVRVMAVGMAGDMVGDMAAVMTTTMAAVAAMAIMITVAGEVGVARPGVVAAEGLPVVVGLGVVGVAEEVDLVGVVPSEVGVGVRGVVVV